MISYHPWGKIDKIIEQTQINDWSLIGCLSYEDRCLSVLDFLKKEKIVKNNNFLKISDPPSSYSEEANNKILLMVAKYDSITQPEERKIEICPLLAPHYNIVEYISTTIKGSTGNIIMDISSFPKRFFFPFIKILLKSDIKNLIVTYTTAKTYFSGDLSEDPEPWEHLPLFGPVEFPEPSSDHAIVGIGFIPFGLSKLLKDKYQDTPVAFFLPFPPGSPYFQRSWEFLRLIEKSYNLKMSDKILRINPLDVSDTYNYLQAITNKGQEKAIFAPYGPKPLSLAFSIFATLYDSPVYYTQPKIYNPSYCQGSGPIFSYLLIRNGVRIYNT